MTISAEEYVLEINGGTAETQKLYKKHLNPITASLIKFIATHHKFVAAKGIYLTDEKGNKYMDFLSGFSAVNLGHEPDEVLSALRGVEGVPNICQSILNPYAAQLAEHLAKVSPGALTKTFFCNSGAEAVEAALKLARCATGKTIFLSTTNAFHGKTFGALSVSGKEKYKKQFVPLVPDTKLIPYDDLNALEEELSKGNVAGFIVEPIQGEAGIIVPQKGYLKGAQKLCNKYNALLIVDEIQTGLGRTGKLFCCEHEQVEPDVLCLSKSLGGGVMPIGAMMTTDKIWKKSYGSITTALLHTSTFGGNTKACACAQAALQLLDDEQLMLNVRSQGEYLYSGLNALKEKFPFIREVRGKGLMIGIHFTKLKAKSSALEGALTLWIVRELFRKHRILTAFTINNYDVMRVMPPLNVNRQQIDAFLVALEDALKCSKIFSKLGVLHKG